MSSVIIPWGLYGTGQSIFIANAVGLYFPLWMKALTGSDALVGASIGAALLSLAFLLPFKGALPSHLGRHPAWLLWSGLGYALLTMSLAMVDSAWVAAVIFFFAYALSGLGYYEQSRMIPLLAKRAEIPRITGLGNAFFASGSILGVPLVALMIGFLGQQVTFPLIGALCLLLSLPLMIYQHRLLKDAPAIAGNLNWRAFSAPNYFIRLFTGQFFHFMAFGAVVSFFAIWATEQVGVSRTMVSGFLTLFFFCSLLGGLAMTKLGEKGLTKLHFFSGGWALLCVMTPFYPTIAVSILVMGLGGLMNGAIFSGYRAFIGFYSDHDKSDLNYGISTSLFYLSQAIGVFSFGVLVETADYTVAWLALAGMFAAAFLAFPRHVPRRGTQPLPDIGGQP